MLVPWQALNMWHLVTTQCAKGAERKRWRMEEEDMKESAERSFKAYRRLLEMVTSFKYMSQVLTAADDNWTEVVGKLKQARKSWAWMTKILGRKGANRRVSGICFKAVVQAVLLF